jgi:hypothetical protein
MMICSHEMRIYAMVYLHLLCRRVCAYYSCAYFMSNEASSSRSNRPNMLHSVRHYILYIVKLPNHYEYTGYLMSETMGKVALSPYLPGLTTSSN